MTDKQIIKALECCILSDLKSCAECPMTESAGCSRIVMSEALTLIRRLRKGRAAKDNKDHADLQLAKSQIGSIYDDIRWLNKKYVEIRKELDELKKRGCRPKEPVKGANKNEG